MRKVTCALFLFCLCVAAFAEPHKEEISFEFQDDQKSGARSIRRGQVRCDAAGKVTLWFKGDSLFTLRGHTIDLSSTPLGDSIRKIFTAQGTGEPARIPVPRSDGGFNLGHAMPYSFRDIHITRQPNGSYSVDAFRATAHFTDLKGLGPTDMFYHPTDKSVDLAKLTPEVSDASDFTKHAALPFSSQRFALPIGKMGGDGTRTLIPVAVVKARNGLFYYTPLVALSRLTARQYYPVSEMGLRMAQSAGEYRQWQSNTLDTAIDQSIRMPGSKITPPAPQTLPFMSSDDSDSQKKLQRGLVALLAEKGEPNQIDAWIESKISVPEAGESKKHWSQCLFEGLLRGGGKEVGGAHPPL